MRTATRLLESPETDALRAKMLVVHERLCSEYRCPIPYFHHDLDPLGELISSLLSHRTKNADSGRAFRNLRQKFGSWEAVRDADCQIVEAAISATTWPEQKAPRIQEALRQITRERGELSLQFLADLPIDEARNWLERIPGVGPKTSAAVLNFSNLRRAALPVDSHHHRVAQRLGLLPMAVDVGPAHTYLAALLPPDWNAQQVYDNHEVFMLHGQRCCFWRAPECSRCPVLEICPFGRARIATESGNGLTPE